MDLGCELEEGKQWPLPPAPCGIIAGTRSFSLKHPVSVMTRAFRFFSGCLGFQCQVVAALGLRRLSPPLEAAPQQLTAGDTQPRQTTALRRAPLDPEVPATPAQGRAMGRWRWRRRG